jgi:hypothetical protein
MHEPPGASEITASSVPERRRNEGSQSFVRLGPIGISLVLCRIVPLVELHLPVKAETKATMLLIK